MVSPLLHGRDRDPGISTGARKKSVPRLLEIEYATGLSLLGLTSGLVSVDSLIGGLKRDTVALLTGSDIRLQAAERYCIRAQLPRAKGGLDGGAFFIDGGNSFDVYMFTDLARRYHLDYDAALDRQSLSHAFTIYELRSLIEESEMVFMARRPKLLVVSEVFSLFTEDIPRYEARRVFRDHGLVDIRDKQGPAGPCAPDVGEPPRGPHTHPAGAL